MVEKPKKKEPTAAQRKLLARRLDMVAAAVACFIDNGYHQTGVRDIAARAGVSLGNLYNHFKSKEEILLEITRIEAAELSEFVKILSGKGKPDKVLQKFIREYLAYCAQPENGLLALEILSVALRNPIIFAEFEANRSELLQALSSHLQKIDSKNMKDTIESALVILDMIEGLALRCVMARKRPTRAQKLTLLEMIASAL